jgi:hypothetical protein
VIKRSFRVRFHLGKGANFMKWRIENVESKEVDFYSPCEVSIMMINAKLYNQVTAANKILCGGNKTVCAWIMCESVHLRSDANYRLIDKVSYNPRIAPHWTNDRNTMNYDGAEFSQLWTEGRGLAKHIKMG